jgi:hypothetical protein
MRSLLFLAADYANITREGKLNVMGIFNNINSLQFPARHSSMHLVAKLEAELGEIEQAQDFAVRLLDEDAQPIFDLSGQFQIPKGARGRIPEINLIFELKDIVFPKPGTYEFVLFIENDQKEKLSLYVNQLDAPQPAGE